MEKPVLIEHESDCGSITIGKCSGCGLFITQPYMVDSAEARLKMEEAFREHLAEKHESGDR
jgi:hypothetical protein